MKQELEYMPGSVFQAQKDKDLDQCHEILDQYTEEAIKLAAEEVDSR